MKTIIGITGTIASGKDSVGEYISKKLKIPSFKISQLILDEAQKRGISLVREKLAEFGKQFAKEFGEDYCAKILLSKIEREGVITGIRQLAQIDFLKDNSNFILISVDAEPKIRFNRTKSRKYVKEAESLERFIKDEIKENSGEGPQKVFECMKLADYEIENNSSIKELYSKIDKILCELNTG